MAKAKVLIVEDDRVVVKDLQGSLEDLGFDIASIVSSGEEALKRAKENKPDIVLMDIVLKGDMDGIETAGQIHSQFDIPVVYLTAYTDEKVLERAKITEPFGYISKPFVERELNIAIEIALYKHKMEKKLKESEKWFSTTLRSVGDAVIATDINGYVTFMNPVAQSLTGWDQEEAIGKPADNVFHISEEKTKEQFENPVTKVIRECRNVYLSNNTLLIAKGRADIPVDLGASPIKDEKGGIIGVVLVFRDITERKRAEEELHKKAELNQVFLNSLPPVAMLQRPHTREIVAANRAGEEVGAVPGKTCYETWGRSDSPCPWCKAPTLWATGEAQHSETYGFGRFCDAYWIPVADDMYLHFVYDITERKRTEEALRESEARYRDLYENAPNAYFSISAVDGSILECNTSATRLLGYDKEILMGMKIFDLYADTPYGLSKAKEVFERFKAGKSIRDTELQMKHKDGYPIWVSLSVEVVRDDHGNVIESKSIGIDISERKRLEAQLLQGQKMEAIGTLAGGIAHDFNNILGAIIGFTETALNHEIPKANPAQYTLKKALKAGHRARDLVNQILTFARQSEGKRVPIQLGPVVKETLKVLKATMPSNFEIRSYIDGESGLIMADPIQIHQVIMNLCSNAAYAMRENGGELEVRLAEVDFDSNTPERYQDIDPGQYVKLTVSDTGCGMSAEVKERIFDPFFTTKKPGEGSGMGLAATYGIVTHYGGAIRLDSEPGKGTTFHIFFPKMRDSVSTPSREKGAHTFNGKSPDH